MPPPLGRRADYTVAGGPRRFWHNRVLHREKPVELVDALDSPDGFYRSASANAASAAIQRALTANPAIGISIRLASSEPAQPPSRSAAYNGDTSRA